LSQLREEGFKATEVQVIQQSALLALNSAIDQRRLHRLQALVAGGAYEL
jgi:hypothetical protein